MTLLNHGTADAISNPMNASLQSRVRRLLTQEFDRRGLLTWDVKLALQCALAGESAQAAASLAFDTPARMPHIGEGFQGRSSNGPRE